LDIRIFKFLFLIKPAIVSACGWALALRSLEDEARTSET